MDKNRFHKKAFTLVEMMISMFIMGILLLGLSYLLQSTIKTNYMVNAKLDLSKDMDFITEVIRRNVSSSDSVNSAFCTGSNSLSLVLDNNVPVTISHDVENGTIIMNGVVISSYNTFISKLQFDCSGNVDGKKSVDIAVVIQARPRSGPYKDSVSAVRSDLITSESFNIGF